MAVALFMATAAGRYSGLEKKSKENDLPDYVALRNDIFISLPVSLERRGPGWALPAAGCF